MAQSGSTVWHPPGSTVHWPIPRSYKFTQKGILVLGEPDGSTPIYLLTVGSAVVIGQASLTVVSINSPQFGTAMVPATRGGYAVMPGYSEDTVTLSDGSTIAVADVIRRLPPVGVSAGALTNLQ